MEELISVIVPVYNVEKYVEKCIESIVNQRYFDLEILLIDDGSTDSSGKICDRYQIRDKRIKVFHKENGGLSDARNYGMKLASGKYIIFIDSDDYLDIEMISLLYSELKESMADISVCGFYEVNEDGSILLKQHDSGKRVLLDRKEAVKAVVEDREINSYVWNKLFKRELFSGIEFPFGRYTQDIFIMYQVFNHAEKVVEINRPLYYYLHRSTSIQGSRGHKLDWDQFCAYVEREKQLHSEYPELVPFMVNEVCSFGIGIYQKFIKDSELIVEDEKRQKEIRKILIKYRRKAKINCKIKVRFYLWMIHYMPLLYEKIYRYK